MDELLIEPWLIEQGMEHDNERWLLETLCEKLYQEKILRPAITTLERMVGGIEEQLHQETYQRLAHLWNESTLEQLNKLLEWDPEQKITLHRWLSQPPTTNSPRLINHTIEKITFLQNLAVSGWDLTAIAVNRRKRLAAIARNNTNQYLQRIKPLRRYPILVCFVWESLLDITDMVLTMYDDYWEHVINGAKKALEHHQWSFLQSQQQALLMLTQAVQLLLDEQIESSHLRDTVFEQLPKEKLEKALSIATGNLKATTQTHLLYVLNYYAPLKQFTPSLLKAFTFEVAFTKDHFEKALQLVKDLQTGKKRKLPDPDEVLTQFLTPSWEKIVLASRNPLTFHQQAYELSTLAILRDRLLSGDVFIRQSRKFADFNSFLLSPAQWESEKERLCQQLGGSDLNQRLNDRMAELESLLAPLEQLLQAGTEIRLEEGVLVVPSLTAEEISDSTKALQQQINLRLPKVSLVEMIREVDSWLNYSHLIQPSNDSPARNREHQSLLYAALFANGCNVPLSDLARSSELDYQSLWWVSNNYLTDENLKKATDLLVNFHHQQWLSSYWGNGTLSSSDGQRFPTSGKIRNAKAQPKYFGYGTGLTFYTHTSDGPQA
jgi:hypothetical protein